MSDNLTPKQRQRLRTINDKLRYSMELTCRLNATDKELLSWCAEQDLISAAAAEAPVFVYTNMLLKQINNRLVQLGVAPFTVDQSVSSLQQAQQGGAEVKSIRQQPRANRILTAQRVGSYWQIIDLDYRSVEPQQYREIIVVENLDCFYQLNDFELPITAQSLIVYRGDSVYGKGRAALLSQWRKSGKPLKYFGDLDIKGFHIAQSEGFSHIAAPALSWFAQQASLQAFNIDQANLLKALETKGEAGRYHKVLHEQRALLQQWLQGVPLLWVETNG